MLRKLRSFPAPVQLAKSRLTWWSTKPRTTVRIPDTALSFFFCRDSSEQRVGREQRVGGGLFFLLAEGQTSREQPPPPQPKRDYIRHHYLRSATRQHPRPPQNSSVCTRFTTCSATPCPGMMHVGRMRSLLGGVNSTTLCPCI